MLAVWLQRRPAIESRRVFQCSQTRRTLLLTPRPSPADLKCHQSQVLVAFPPRDLTNTDLEQPVKTVRVQLGSDAAFTGPADRAP